MATSAVMLKIDGENIAHSLQEAKKKLDSAESEIFLDFSSVHRLDAAALRALEEIAGRAGGKTTKIQLSNVNVNVYKVLKLTRLASRFSFHT